MRPYQMSKKLRVLMIVGSWPPIHCGVGDYTSKLNDRLVGLGLDMHVLTSQKAKHSESVHNIVQEWDVFHLLKILQNIMTLKPDIIHMQYPSVMYRRNLFPNFLPYLIKRKFPNIPLILTIHEYHDVSTLGKRRTQLCLLGPDAIILTNQEDALDLSKYLGEKQHIVIPIGNNIEIADQISRQLKSVLGSYGLVKDKYWLYTGFVDSTKGVEKLIRAVNFVEGKMPLVIATDFDKNNEYHVRVQRLIHDEAVKVVWTGYVKTVDLSHLLHGAYAVVLPFDRPATARRGTVITALAHGKAVITTGNTKHSVFSRGAALIDENSTEAIIRAMNELVQNKKKRSRLEKIAKVMADNYAWPSIAQAHQRLYLERSKS